MSAFIGRHWRPVTLVLGITAVFLVLYLLRNVLLPFILGLVLAYLFAPLVNWLEAKLPCPKNWLTFRRITAIIIVFLIIMMLAAVFAYFIVAAVVDASIKLAASAPFYIREGLQQVREWFAGVRDWFPPEIQEQLDEALVEAGPSLGNAIRSTIRGAVSVVPATAHFLVGLVVLPLFLFYTLKDSERLKKSLYSAFSPGMARHIKNLTDIIERVLGRYIRAQVVLGLIVAYFAFVGLLILRIPFSPVLAILAGIGELIPTLGPWVSGAVVVLVTLAVAPDKALWVIVLFLSIQLLENGLLVPRIQGGYLRIHPAVMIVLLVVGASLAGFWGLILAGPLAATVAEIYKYIRCCFEEESAATPPEE